MKRYPVGATVPVDIPFVDLNGEPVDPTGVTVRVLDGSGEETVAEQSLAFDPSDSYITWNVPGAGNALAADVFEDIRTVEIAVTTAVGVFRASTSYIVLQDIRLSPPKNSFQLYEGALLQAERELGVTTFAEADKRDQIAALRIAFETITKLRFHAIADEPNSSDLFPYTEVLPTDWQNMTSAEWSALPAQFKQSLMRAQVIEANHLLTVDPVADRHEKGLLSESIGESSMMFRSVKPLNLGVSKKTMQVLSRYVQFAVGVGRA